MIRVLGSLVLSLFVFATLAQAAPVLPTRYDMPNGYGQASSGTFNYWDRSYSGSGVTTTDGAPLSGGLGDLTDGVIAPNNWNQVENAAGTGPYVGWINVNPTITFHFNSVLAFDSVRIHFDDADGFGGVKAPLNVVINGTTFPVADPAGATPFFAQFNLGNLTTNQLTIQLQRRDLWVFASEFSFSAANVAVPEPSSFVLLGISSVIVTSLSWRRRNRHAPASKRHP